MEKRISIPYSSISNFPQTSTTGHAGEWVFGYVNQKPIIVANGRFHYYEGFSLNQVTSTVSTIFELGCNNLIITNAAGCLNLKWNIGEFMLIKGYLDYTFILVKVTNVSNFGGILHVEKYNEADNFNLYGYFLFGLTIEFF